MIVHLTAPFFLQLFASLTKPASENPYFNQRLPLTCMWNVVGVRAAKQWDSLYRYLHYAYI